MALDDLRRALEQNANDTRTFQTHLDPILKSGEKGAFDEFLAVVLEAVSNDESLANLMRAADFKAKSAGGEMALHVAFKIGQVFQQRLGNDDMAEMYYRRLPAESEAAASLRDFYIDYYLRKENWRKLEQLFAAMAQAEGMAAPESESKRRTARLARERGNADRALAYWQALRKELPDDREVLGELVELYEQTDKWHQVAELLKAQADGLPEGEVEEKSRLLNRLIPIFRDRLQNDAKVASTYQALLALQPENPEAFEALCRYYREAGRWPDLVKLLRQRIEALTDPSQLYALHGEIAQIMEERFSNVAEAMRSLEAMLELVPGDLAVVGKLKGLYEQRRDWPRFIAMARLELATLSGRERVERLRALARMALENVRTPEMGIELWGEVREALPDDREAFDALMGLYERNKDFEGVARLLEERIELEGPEGRVQLLERLATIYSARVGDMEQAANCWQRLLELDGENLRAKAELKKILLRSKDLEALDRFFRSHSTPNDYQRALEQLAKEEEEPLLKAQLLFRQAALCLESGGREEKARAALEEVLAVDPQNTDAAEQLVGLYQSLGRWEELVRVQELLLAEKEEMPADERLGLLLAKAVVHEEQLGQIEEAFFTFVSAYRLRWSRPEILTEMERLAGASGNWEVCISVEEQALELMADDRERVPHLLRIAQNLESKAADLERAADYFLQVLAVVPGLMAALSALGRIYGEMERWPELREILTRQLEQESGAAERARLLMQLGSLCEERLGDAVGAIAAYGDLVSEFPELAEAHDRLAGILLREERYEELLPALEARLAALELSGTALADALVDIAMLYYGTGGEVLIAGDRCVEALQVAGDHPRAVALLEELIGAQEVQLRAARALEPVYQGRGDDRRLADVLEIELSWAEEGERVPILRQLQQLYLRMDDSAAAFLTIQRLLRLVPEEADLRAELEMLAELLNEWYPVVALYSEIAAGLTDQAYRHEVLRAAAGIYHIRLGDRETARELFRSVLAESPDDGESIAALQGIAIEEEDWQGLLELYEARREYEVDAEGRIGIMFEIAQLRKERLADLAGASRTVEEIIELDPTRREALALLDELYTLQERWGDLLRALEQTLELATEREVQVELLLRIAELLERRLEDLPGMVDRLERVLGLDDGSEPAVTMLERNLGGAVALRALDLLDGVMRRRGEWARLIEFLKLRQELVDEGDERLAVLKEVARVYEEELQDRGAAFASYRLALAMAPEDEGTLDRLLALSEVVGNFEELFLVLDEESGRMESSPQQVRMWRVQATIARDRLQDAATAIDYFVKVQGGEPDDLEAVVALAALYREGENWGRLVELLGRQIELTVALEEKRGLLLELGAIHYGYLEQPDQAIAAYEELLLLDPGDETALGNLENLYSETERWEELEQVLERRAGLPIDASERKELRLRRAEVLEHRLERLDEANQVLTELFQAAPEDLDLVNRLESLHEKREDWFSLLGTVRHKLTLVAPEERPALLLKIARTRSGQLQDVRSAVATYGEILEQFPGEEAVVDDLEQLILEGEEKEPAYLLLKPLLEGREAWERLLVSMAAFKESLADADQRLGVLLEMAAIARERANDPERAFYMAAEGLELSPHRLDVADLLEQIAHQGGLLEQAVAVYAQCAGQASSQDESVALMKRRGELLKNVQQDFPAAVEQYEALRELSPDRQVLEALDELYLVLDRFDKLAEVLREEIDGAVELDEKLLLYYRLAELTDERLEAPAQAAEVLKEAYLLSSEREETLVRMRRLFDLRHCDPESAELLEASYSSHQQWGEVAAVLTRRFELAGEEAARLEIAHKLVSVYLSRLSDAVNGLRFAGEALVLDPADYAIRQELLRLGETTGMQEAVVSYLQQAQLRTEDLELFRALGMDAGRLLRATGRNEEAEHAYAGLIERDEAFVDAWLALEQLHEEAERGPEHERVLVRLVELQEYEDDRIPLLLKLGRLRRDRLANLEEAVAAFAAVRAIDERNEEALNSLAALYDELGRNEELAGVLGAMVDLATEVDERVSLLARLAGLQEDRLANPAKAIQAWSDILDWTPNAAFVLENLQRLYRQQGEWPSFVEMAEREAMLAASTVERRLELWRQMARAARQELDDAVSAQTNWMRVIEAEPADREAQTSLRELYRINEDHFRLAQLLERLACDQGLPAEERLSCWIELGRVKMDEVMDVEGAILAWSEVLDLAADYREAYEALERLYLEGAHFASAVELLRRKLSIAADQKEQVALLDRIAALLEESLGNWQDAAAARMEIIGIEPLDLGQYDRVGDIYESHQQWTALAGLLRQRVEVEEEPGKQVETLSRLARICEEQLGDDAAAMAALMQAQAINRGELDLLEAGERVATRSGLWQELYQLWSSAVDHLDEEHRIETMLKLGALLRDRLENFGEAVDWYVKVTEERPDSEPALRALTELYEVTENWSKLAQVVEALAAVTADFHQQVALCLQLGDLWFHKLGDGGRAQAAYRQVLELDPTEERAVESLQALYTESEQWQDLIDILGVRASIHPEEDGELKLIAGDLLEHQLKEPLKAAEQYEELVAYAPAAAGEAFNRLVRIYTEHELWDKLAETYERLLSVKNEEGERVEILRRLALLNETVINNGEAAADFYQQVLDYRPDDVETIASLEKLYEEQGRFDDLVLVLRRTVQLAESVREKVAYLEKIARISADKLEDLHSAIMAYKEILEHDPAHTETLERLEVLLGQEGDWMEVLNVLDLRLRVASNTAEVVGYYLRKGEIYQRELLAPDKALEQYRYALERSPDHLDALERVIALYEAEENWDRIIETLLARAKAVSDEAERARIFAEMGRYFKDRMGEPDRAIEVFEAALERVPHLAAALSPLADLYMDRQRWEKAVPLLEMQAQLQGEGAAPEEQAALYRRLAQACMSTGNRGEALAYFRKAYDKNPEDLATLEGLATLNQQQGNYEVAAAYYGNLLKRGGDSFPIDRQIFIYRSLGELEIQMGHPDQARDYLARVLELKPNDIGCINDLVSLMEYHSDWEGAIRFRRQLVDLLSDPLDKWKMLIAIGDTYREKLDRLELAIRAYNEALEAQPYSRSALVKLLEIHINARAFAEAINVLQHLVQVEDNPGKKAAYVFTIATIYREELKEPEMAVEYYDQTLDLHPEKLEAFRGIDEILTSAKNWEELEAAYRRMAQRVRGKGLEKVEFMLYKGLGEIYRSRLRAPDRAAAAFELAIAIKADDMAIQEILAQLYELQGSLEKAVAAHRTMTAVDPERLESYRKLAQLLDQLGRSDDAWFARSVLAMANRLTPEEKTLFAAKQGTGLPPVRRSLDHEGWTTLLFSKAENPAVGEVFQIIYQAIGAYLEGSDPKELGLKRRDELDLKQKTVFSSVFNHVCNLLAIPAPTVYLSDRSFGMRIEATIPPVIVIGKDMLHGKSEKELAFIIGKNLTYFHPMHILAACYPAPVLKLLYQVALHFVHPEVPVEGGDSEQFKVLSDHLRRRISPQLANSLAQSINQFHKANKRPGISAWLTGVELTANHAGLLANLDLAAATAVLRQESVAFSKLPPREKAKELVLFAVSEEFAKVRKALALELPR